MPSNLFDTLPSHLFGPLASSNRRLHWEILVRLGHFLLEEELGSTEYGYSASQVRDIIETVLNESKEIWRADPSDPDSVQGPETPTRIRASTIYNALRDSGWLVELHRGYRKYVSIPPKASQALAALEELAEGQPLMMAGKLKSLEAGMRQVEAAPGEHADMLMEVVKDASRFARHMSGIKGAIKELYDHIQSSQGAREIVASFFDEFLEDVLIRDYAPLKTSENPLHIRDTLLSIVGRLRHDTQSRTQLVQGYHRIFPHMSPEESETRVDRDLSRLETIFYNVDRQLDAIDAMRYQYERRVDLVIDYAIRSPSTLSRDLKRLTSAIARLGDTYPEHQIAVPLAFAEHPGQARLAKPKRHRPPPPPRTVSQKQISDQARNRIRRKREARLVMRIDDAALVEFLSTQMGDRTRLTLPEIVIRTAHDYFCVLALSRAAHLPEYGVHRFPDTLSQFRIALTEEGIETEYFRMRNLVITRTGASYDS